METPKVLPNIEGRRFGAVSFGYDRVQMIREEFSVLTSLAALLLNMEPDKVTRKDVEVLVADLQELSTTAGPEELLSKHPRQLMAWGVAQLHQPTEKT